MRCSGGHSIVERLGVDRLDRVAPLGDRGHLGDRDRRGAAATSRPCRARSAGERRARREELGERDVDVGGRRAEGARRLAEVLAARRGAQRDAPGVLDVREELLRERQRSGHRALRGREVRPRALDRSDRAGHVRRSGVGERGRAARCRD